MSLPAGQQNQVFASGLAQPEGPVVLSGGAIAVVEMDECRACVTRLDGSNPTRIFTEPGARPTGLALDGDDCLWVAGGGDGAVLRLSPQGEVLKRISGDTIGPFLFPNDLAFGPDGLLYLSDSGMTPSAFISGLAIRPDFASAQYDGRIFQIDPATGEVRRLAAGLRFANGLAFGADDALYFNETLSGWIWRQVEGRDPEPWARASAASPSERFQGPDGMAFDRDGRLYCAIYGEGRIAVLEADGAAAASRPTNGDRPTNLCFAPGLATLLITEVEHGAVETMDVASAGLALHRPRLGR